MGRTTRRDFKRGRFSTGTTPAPTRTPTLVPTPTPSPTPIPSPTPTPTPLPTRAPTRKIAGVWLTRAPVSGRGSGVWLVRLLLSEKDNVVDRAEPGSEPNAGHLAALSP